MKNAMANLVRLAATAGLIVSLADSGGCSSEARCFYNHQSHAKGTSFPDEDGCNTCTCVASGAVECTLMGCLPDAAFEHPAPPVDPRDGPIDAAPDVALPVDAATADGADHCVLPTALTFYVEQTFRVDSGIASYTETCHLDNDGLVITRDWWNGYDAEYTRSCKPVLPACGLTDQITVENVVVDLADPAVAAALASPPNTTFGAAKWPADAMTMSAETGSPIRVGLPCGDPDAGPCQPIPPALQRLRDDLAALAAAGTAQATCVEMLKR